MSENNFRDPREYDADEAYDAAYDDSAADSDAYDSAEASGYRGADDSADYSADDFSGYRGAVGDCAPDSGEADSGEREPRPSLFRRISGACRRGADTTISDVIHGRILSIDFFRRHWLAILGIVAMLMIYITNRYTCQTQMETIQRLQHDLEVVKTERVREKSAYMSRIRESKMQAEVDSLRLGLTVQEQPPFRLSLK